MNTRSLCAVLLLVVGAAGCSDDVAPNEPPTLTLNVGTEEAYVVGDDVVQIQATATDPDGGDVSFEVLNRPERAELQTFSNSALFTWDPITSDVTDDAPLRLIFVAEDSRGARAEEVVHVTIRPGNGTPKFLTASSKLYDPSSDEPLAFEVEVRDDDSRQVILSMPTETAPTGASFAQVADKAGKFRWEPSDEQRARRVHSVTFVADDDDNEPVAHEVTLILQGAGGGANDDPEPAQSCEDVPISHDPIGAQRTLDDYEIEASFSASAATKYDTAYLFWTTGDAMNEEVEFDSAEMKIDGTRLRAAIPNLLLPEGASEVVYYSVCAMDEDAPDDADDAFVCAPSWTYFSFRAYSPDETICIDDHVGSSFEDATPIPDDVWGTHAVCESASDVHTFTVGAGEVVDLYVTYSLGQQIGVKLYDDAEKQRDDITFSECEGVAYIPLDAPGSGEKTWFVEVDGADAPYQISAFRQQDDSGGCGDQELEPNDTTADATLVFDDAETFEGVAICEPEDIDIYAFDMLVGDEVDTSLSFSHADGDLDASLFAPSQADSVNVDGYGVSDGWSTTDDEHLFHTAEESGIYNLLVFSSSTANTYDLTIETSCGDDDAFGSSNHSQDEAAPIGADDHTGLKMCAGRPDWYRRTGSASEPVLAELRVDQGALISDVDFSVYDADGRIKSATADGDRLQLDFTPATAGEYFYKVSGTKDMVYELTIVE